MPLDRKKYKLPCQYQLPVPTTKMITDDAVSIVDINRRLGYEKPRQGHISVTSVESSPKSSSKPVQTTFW